MTWRTQHMQSNICAFYKKGKPLSWFWLCQWKGIVPYLLCKPQCQAVSDSWGSVGHRQNAGDSSCQGSSRAGSPVLLVGHAWKKESIIQYERTIRSVGMEGNLRFFLAITFLGQWWLGLIQESLPKKYFTLKKLICVASNLHLLINLKYH